MPTQKKKNYLNKTLRLNSAVFLKEASFFLLVQILGLLVARRLFTFPEIAKIEASPPSFSNPLIFLGIFALTTIVFLLLVRFFRKTPFFLKIFLGIAIFIGLDIVFGAFFGEPLAFSLALILVGLRFFYNNILLHNFLFSLALAGIGGFLGLSFSPKVAVMVLVVLAGYDLVAVYLTKHMVRLARSMIKEGVFLGIIIPRRKEDSLKRSFIFSFKRKNFYFLGGGDLALPLILVASIGRTSLLKGGIVIFFSLFGLFLMNLLFMGQKERRPMPALPPIVLGSLLGYLVATLF